MVRNERRRRTGRPVRFRRPSPNTPETMKKIDEYLEALSESIDYDIEPGELDSHVILIDDDLSVVMREDETGAEVKLLSIVAPSFPKGISYQDAEDLVDMACGPFYGGPGLGRLPLIGSMILFQTLPYARTTKEEFVEKVGEFLDLAVEYFDKFAEMGDGYGDDDEDEEDEDEYDEEEGEDGEK